MAIVLKGRTQVGDIPNFKYEGAGKDILDLLEIGNSPTVQSTQLLNAILSKVEVEKGVGIGAKMPIEHFNVYFQKGGIETASAEMKKQIESFTMKYSMGYNVMAFDYSAEDEYKADNAGIDLNAEATDKVAKITSAYVSNYLPYARLCAILTGTSLGEKIPAKSNGTDRGYTDAFGALRGEDVTDWLLPTALDKKRNHYRVVKTSAGVTEDDVYECIRMMTSYRTYSRKGIVCLGAPSSIQKLLGNAYTAPVNVDDVMVNKVDYIARKPFGIDWVEIPEFEGHDFFIFMDKGRFDILFRRVEPSEKYRGLGILTQDKQTTFSTVTELKGSKLRIFPEEWYLTAREAVLILDLNGTRAQSSGEMDTASITALENFASLCMSAYDLEMKEAQA